MIVEQGKYYKTRDGRKVGPMVKGILSVWPFEAKEDGNDRAFGTRTAWRLDGTFDPHSSRSAHALDLVALWQEPTSQGPVRTKTVKEVVPGMYSGIVVDGGGDDSGGFVRLSFIRSAMHSSELRAAALVLTQLAEALEQ